MIFGADSQNKNLKDAASKRIDTTPRTRTSNKLAAKIATNGTNKSTNKISNKETVTHQSRSKINDGVPDPVRGSLEGYMHAPSTVLQPNGIGYDRKSIQKARYKNKYNLKKLDISKKNFAGFKKHDKISRYGSITAKNSSAHKMNSKLTVEKMFK